MSYAFKNILLFLAAAVLTATATGCISTGGSAPVPDTCQPKKPAWVSGVCPKDGYFYGVGVAGPQRNLLEQKEVAVLLAKRDLAARIKARVTSRLSTLKTVEGHNGRERVENWSQFSLSEEVDLYLNRVEVVDFWFDQSRDLLYGLVRVPKNFKGKQ